MATTGLPRKMDLLGMTAVFVLCAGCATNKNTDTEADLAQLRTLNARFINNYVTNDVASHDKLIHKDFVYITSKGARVSREAYLKKWATGFDPNVTVYWDYRDESIRIFGQMALVRSTNKYTLRKNDTETTGMSVYTDTYVKEDGEWKCVQAQISTVTPENYPSDTTIVRKYIRGIPQ